VVGAMRWGLRRWPRLPFLRSDVAAITIATLMEAADLAGLLSRLAVSVRDDATMRIKVEVGRQRLRTPPGSASGRWPPEGGG
jgi:hypothetical protein